MSAFGHSVRLARIDVIRMLRNHTDWRSGSSSILGLVMYGLLVIAGTLGGGYLGYRMGRSLAADEPLFGIGPFSASIVGGILALFWLIFMLIFAVRAVGQRGTLAQPEGVLTVVPTRVALAGVYLAEFTYVVLWVFGPAVGLGAGLAVGTGTVPALIAVPVAVLAAGLTAVTVGYPIGLSIRHVASRYPFVARNKGVIIAVVFLVYFAALLAGTIDRLVVALFEPMQASPTAWYADLLFLGTPGVDVSAARAGGAVTLTLVLTVIGTVAGTRIAEIHWFSDPALAGEKPASVVNGVASPGIERRVEGILGPQMAALVILSWRRAVRAPLKLLYAFFPVFAMAGLLGDVVQSGEVPAYLPFVTLLFAAWAAGVIFTLNPLGDQGAALSSTLLSRVDGRTFVRAHLLAGLAVAIPAGTVLTAVIAVLSPIETDTVLALVIATPVVMVLSAAFSIGVGMAFPRFEAINVTRSMKTVLPSRWAFVLFSAYLFVTASAAGVVYESGFRELAAAFVSWALPFGIDIAADTLYLLSAALLVTAVVLTVASYRHAIHRFDRYTIA
ncbi:hypothetical protein [Halapricum hydrolyticum]|uniref:Uncharacterized protein n=1 Tax=Halapricum hydrolyticum TaxID=2979991 RepID=A0AAE3LK47_9EURY|nr:hypothetical protein [Halapricum hydrolyticum]MCU4719024.1 hypothetical protein [Halapricum hydrolyticum]MCU4728013.1 hypothetical protein [Halapricum hydrolyticum]